MSLPVQSEHRLITNLHRQPGSHGRSEHRLGPWAASCPRARRCTSGCPSSQSEPRPQHAECSTGRGPGGEGRRTEPPYECPGRTHDGGGGRRGTWLAGLVLLWHQIRCSARYHLLQLQPDPLSVGDEHAADYVPVSTVFKWTCVCEQLKHMTPRSTQTNHSHFLSYRHTVGWFPFRRPGPQRPDPLQQNLIRAPVRL